MNENKHLAILRVCNEKSTLESKIRFAEELVNACQNTNIEMMSLRIKDMFSALTDTGKQQARLSIWVALQDSITEHNKTLQTKYSPAGIAQQIGGLNEC